MGAFNSIFYSFQSVGQDLLAFMPRVLVSVLLLTGGWILARLVRKAVIYLLRLARLEDAAERAGIDNFLLRGGVRYTFVTIIAEIIYWFLISTVIFTVLDVLGISEGGKIFTRVIYYVPNVMIALVILIFGTLISRFVHIVAFAYLNNIGINNAGIISSLAHYALIAFVFFMALEQLAIDEEILKSAFQIGFGGFALAFALAFGFGGRDYAKSLLEKIKKQSE